MWELARLVGTRFLNFMNHESPWASAHRGCQMVRLCVLQPETFILFFLALFLCPAFCLSSNFLLLMPWGLVLRLACISYIIFAYVKVWNDLVTIWNHAICNVCVKPHTSPSFVHEPPGLILCICLLRYVGSLYIGWGTMFLYWIMAPPAQTWMPLSVKKLINVPL